MVALDDILNDLDAKKNRIQSNLDKLQNKPVKPLTESRTEGPGKRLTETERLIIASERLSGKSIPTTAKEYGVSESTVVALAADTRLKYKLALADTVKRGLSAELYIKAQASLDKITDDRLEKVNAYQNAIITATLIDKARLIEGQNTQQVGISAVIGLVDALRGYQSPPVDIDYTPITNDIEGL